VTNSGKDSSDFTLSSTQAVGALTARAGWLVKLRWCYVAAAIVAGGWLSIASLRYANYQGAYAIFALPVVLFTAGNILVKVHLGRLRNSAADETAPDPGEDHLASSKRFKKAVKALVKDLPPLSDVVKEAVQQAAESPGNTLSSNEVRETVKEAVKEAVKEGIKEAVKDAVEETEPIG
jgi:hypothetical protein